MKSALVFWESVAEIRIVALFILGGSILRKKFYKQGEKIHVIIIEFFDCL